MFKLLRVLILGFIVSVIVSAMNGQASSETNQYPSRGEGVGLVSGYAISDVHYHLGDDPTYISAVEFELDKPASQVMIGFDNPSNHFFICLNSSGDDWICEVNDVELSDVYKLQVIATG
jgi:hypothetical protein